MTKPGTAVDKNDSGSWRRRVTALFGWPDQSIVCRRAQLSAALGTVCALIFTSSSFRATQIQIGLTEQRQLTDRFNKAVEKLGSGKAEIRLGAIHALERLGWDPSTVERQPVLIVCGAGCAVGRNWVKWCR